MVGSVRLEGGMLRPAMTPGDLRPVGFGGENTVTVRGVGWAGAAVSPH